MMSLKKDCRVNYSKEAPKGEQQGKHNKSSRWFWILFWILISTPLLIMLVPKIIKDSRLHSNYVETTAHVKRLYKSGKGHNIKCVSYSYCVNDQWYDGHTSPPDSIWDKLHTGSPFEIVYEMDDPSNSNWAGYYKKK